MALFVADLLLILHSAWVGFVLLAVPATLLGALLKWQWVRNRWFRGIHLGMVLIVTIETALDLPCPLTVWEERLRQQAGHVVYGEQGTFIGYWLGKVLYYDFPVWVFTLAYLLFFVLVAALYRLVPPHPKARR